MKLFISIKFYFLLFIFTFSLILPSYSANQKASYSSDDIYNYFSGIISFNHNNASQAFKYFSRIKQIKNKHNDFNVKFVRTLVELEKFNKAFKHLKRLDNDKLNFSEAYILLGVEAFAKKDFLLAEKFFKQLNNFPLEEPMSNNIMKNILISWAQLGQRKREEAFNTMSNISDRFYSFKLIQKTLINCYLESPNAKNLFYELIKDSEFNFSRYNFFLANYLLHQDEVLASEKIIDESLEIHDSNLLLRQSKILFDKKDFKKIQNFFDCKNPSNALSEFFYIISNFHSNEQNFSESNFYLKIALYLNPNFYTNTLLLGENLFYLKKYDQSKKIYLSLTRYGGVFSWYAKIRIARIISITTDKKKGLNFLQNEFNTLDDPSAKNIYDLANFYKDHSSFEQSIKYYSLALDKLPEEHKLLPKILDNRGTSYERLKIWDKAERDLLHSLKLSPDQPYVLNYLAYSWLERKINIDESYEMLEKANRLKQNDPYIMDSLGWAMYLMQNYTEAEKFLRRAIELMPLDPTINDHYADVLWKLKRDIQARYFWKYVLGLNATDSDLREKINKKLIYGVL